MVVENQKYFLPTKKWDLHGFLDETFFTFTVGDIPLDDILNQFDGFNFLFAHFDFLILILYKECSCVVYKLN